MSTAIARADLEKLRPQTEQLSRDAEELERKVASLDRRLAEAVAGLASLQGFATEVQATGHQLRSLRASIMNLLDELDQLTPPAPGNGTPPAAGKGGRA